MLNVVLLTFDLHCSSYIVMKYFRQYAYLLKVRVGSSWETGRSTLQNTKQKIIVRK